MYNELKRQHKRNYLYFEKIFSIIQDQGQYYKQKSRETKNDGKRVEKAWKVNQLFMIQFLISFQMWFSRAYERMSMEVIWFFKCVRMRMLR